MKKGFYGKMTELPVAGKFAVGYEIKEQDDRRHTFCDSSRFLVETMILEEERNLSAEEKEKRKIKKYNERMTDYFSRSL